MIKWEYEHWKGEHVRRIPSLQTASVIYCPTCCHPKMQSMFFNQSSSSTNGCDESKRSDAKIDFSAIQQLQQCFHHYSAAASAAVFVVCVKISFRLQWQHLWCSTLLTIVRFGSLRFVFIEHFVLQFFSGLFFSKPSVYIYDIWTVVFHCIWRGFNEHISSFSVAAQTQLIWIL